MRVIRAVCLSVWAATFPLTSLIASTPFPDGYEVTYQAFVNELPATGKKATWLTKLNGVSSPPKTMSVRGKPMLYLFACKNHYCDTDNVNVFLAPDHKTYRAVLKMGGKQSLLGGAGAAELDCVRALDAVGGALDAC